jgi:phage N-6-adenine-methyltransferase
VVDKVLFQSVVTEWETPDDLFASLDREFRFTIDVCATAGNRKVETFYSKEDDALTQPWNGRVWCNPPYKRGLTEKFIKKGVDEVSSNEACELAVFLLPSRTDTQWFHECIWDSAAHHPRTGVEMRLLRGRVKFIGAVTANYSAAPFPSVVVVFRKGKR